MTDRVPSDYSRPQDRSGDSLRSQTRRVSIPQADSATMNSREPSEIPPAPSYPSPNTSQIGQGTMPYYANQRQLTAEELHLSAELSREVSGANIADPPANGMGHGQSMELGAPASGATDANRGAPSEHHQQQQPQQTPHQQHQHPQHQTPQQQQQAAQQHLLQFTTNQQVGVDPNHDLSYGDQSARRKRSKVSRACDECRRKKVRCDATSESGVETCSNCRRTNATCEFSRVPMKRGPSKGYIKELADRINSLESHLQPGMGGQDMQYPGMHEDGSPREYQEFSPSVDNQLLSRKRTFSMSEGLPNAFMQPAFGQGPRPSSVGGWPVQTPAKDASNISAADGMAALDIYSGAPPANAAAKVSQPFWSQEGASADQHSRMEGVVEAHEALSIDEKVLDVYYHHVHPILPFLPNSRERLHYHLQHTSRQIQEIFLHSLLALTGASLFRAEKQLQEIPTFEKAQDQLYATFREDPTSRPLSVNLVLLQSIILMILESDARGPENLRGQNGIPKSVLVETAYSLSHFVAKLLGQLRTSNPEDKDADSDGNVARRNWATVMVLSRMHTISVAGPDFFGVYEAATFEDREILGLATLQLARYSTVLSEINELFFDPATQASSSHGIARALKRNMHGQLSRVREVEALSLEGPNEPARVANNEILSPLMFWFINLLLKRQLYTFVPSEVLYPAEVIIDILQKQSELPTPSCSPFHYHFLALAVVTLLEITDIPELSNEAWTALDKALQIITQREKHAATAGEFEKIFATQSWEACVRSFIEVKLTKVRAGHAGATGENTGAQPLVGPTEQRSLQHLADLAVGAGGNASVNPSSPPPASAGQEPPGVGDDKDTGPATAGATGSSSVFPEAPLSDAKHQQATRVFVDFTLLTKKGYLNVLAGN